MIDTIRSTTNLILRQKKILKGSSREETLLETPRKGLLKLSKNLRSKMMMSSILNNALMTKLILNSLRNLNTKVIQTNSINALISSIRKTCATGIVRFQTLLQLKKLLLLIQIKEILRTTVDLLSNNMFVNQNKTMIFKFEEKRRKY